MSNLSELIPAGGGQNNTDFVADGAITSGKPVILTAAGKAAQVAVETVSTNLGADSDFNGGNSVQMLGGCFDAATNTQVLIYRNGGVSNYWHVVIGAISGSTTVWGTPVQVKASSNSSNPASVCSIGGGKIIATYLDASGYQYARCGTITAATKTIVFGTEITLFSTATYMTAQALAYSSVRNATVCVVNRYNYAFVYRLTVSGTTITADLLDNTGNSTLNGQAQLVNITGTDGFMIASRYTSGANKFGIGKTFTLSASAWDMATISLSFSATVESNVTLAYDSSIARYVTTYQNSSDNYVYYTLGTNGSSVGYPGQLTWTTPTVLISSASTVYGDALSTSYNIAKDRVVTLHKKNSDYKLYYNVGAVGASTIAWDATVAFSGAFSGHPVVYYDSTAERNIIAYASTGSDLAVANVMTLAGDYANLTATNLLGIASGAILDTATGTINTWGSRNEAQTSLTIGSDYYVQEDGTITTASASPAQLIGQAITATQINIKDYTG